MATAQSRDITFPWRRTTITAYSDQYRRKDGGIVRSLYLKDGHTGTLLQLKANQAYQLRDELDAALAEMEHAAARRTDGADH